MGKKNDDTLDKLVEDLLVDASDDRDRISKFLDDLLMAHADQPAAIAEYVAKIADSLTKQQAIRVATLKTAQKVADLDEDDGDDITGQIGVAFAEEVDEGSN